MPRLTLIGLLGSESRAVYGYLSLPAASELESVMHRARKVDFSWLRSPLFFPEKKVRYFSVIPTGIFLQHQVACLHLLLDLAAVVKLHHRGKSRKEGSEAEDSLCGADLAARQLQADWLGKSTCRILEMRPA